MAEAYKCDVVGCNIMSEGSPAGKFMSNQVSKHMCPKHTEALVESYFPDMKPKPEPAPAPVVDPAAEGKPSEA